MTNGRVVQVTHQRRVNERVRIVVRVRAARRLLYDLVDESHREKVSAVI